MKLAYLCKYVPVELLESLGCEVELAEPDVSDFSEAEMCMHPNMCSFIKAVLEDYRSEDYDGIVLTNCCDSTRRLHDSIKAEFPDRFVYMLDVPRLVTEESAGLFAGSMGRLAEAVSERTRSELDEAALRKKLDDGYEHGGSGNKESSRAALNIAVMGARLGNGVRELLDEYDVSVVDDMTCTETDRRYHIEGKSGILEEYGAALLGQFPCMRMYDVRKRIDRLEDDHDRIDGVIYHTMKFCDMYSYEFAYLNKYNDLPVLKIETDSTSQSAGQLRTRIEAFLESLAKKKGLPPEAAARMTDPVKKNAGADVEENDREKENSDMFGFMRKKSEKTDVNAGAAGGADKNGRAGTGRGLKTGTVVVGIDSGSTSTNAVALDQDRNILASVVIRTGARSIDSARQAYEELLKKAGLDEGSPDMVVSTGYGRVNIDFADREITEITCHGRGASYFDPEARTILDIGGQDSKAIRIDEKGNVIDFAMNDKCAAGTGRFLEMMAATLGVSMDELGPLSLGWHEDIDISSMCSVFAESEVISLIADNREKADIAHGVHKSIASRAVSLMKRVGLEEGFMMTGGVAKNPGAVREIEKKAGGSLYICDEPEIVGAVGAALLGLEELTA